MTNCVYRIDFHNIKSLEQLFLKVGIKLEFELIPKKSWDAFLDQYREFCSNCERDTVLVFENFEKFSKSQFQLATKLTETMSYAVNEHCHIIKDHIDIPEDKRLHGNKDVRISLVLK